MRLKILETLLKAFPEASIEVVDESDRHRGHPGNTLGANSHFCVTIKCNTLRLESRLVRHQRVYDALKDIMLQIHALTINFE